MPKVSANIQWLDFKKVTEIPMASSYYILYFFKLGDMKMGSFLKWSFYRPDWPEDLSFV